MPKRKIKQARKRRRVRSGYSGKGSSMVNFSQLLIPARLRTRLRYVDQFAMTSTAGAIVSQVFRGNSVYDPDFSNVGHQPNGYDQLANFYLYYRVFSSLIRVVVGAVGTTGANSGFWSVIYPSTNSTASNQTMIEAVEQPRSVSGYNTSQLPWRGIRRASTTEIMGLGKGGLSENDYAAAVAANPATQWYWIVQAQTQDASTTGSAFVLFELEYDVEFWGRVTIQASSESKIKFANDKKIRMMKDSLQKLTLD